MHFNEYQTKAGEFAQYPELFIKVNEDDAPPSSFEPVPYLYSALGLAGETGEVVEKIKKIIRNQQGEIMESDRDLIQRELGDVLWYLADLADLFLLSLDDIAQTNLEKLEDRAKRGVIASEGDTR